jgi:mRNA interferase MazF
MGDRVGVTVDRGTVVLVELDPTIGHEQRGLRPCVAVSDPAVNADQRFPLIAVVPVTGTPGIGALYPALAEGASGLIKPSCALVDHLRSIDKRRVRRIFGRISAAELASIDRGLELFLGLDGARWRRPEGDESGGAS